VISENVIYTNDAARGHNEDAVKVREEGGVVGRVDDELVLQMAANAGFEDLVGNCRVTL